MLKSGDKLWNGAIVTPQLAAAYNAATVKIEAIKQAGKSVPENILNGRHNLISNVPK